MLCTDDKVEVHWVKPSTFWICAFDKVICAMHRAHNRRTWDRRSRSASDKVICVLCAKHRTEHSAPHQANKKLRQIKNFADYFDPSAQRSSGEASDFVGADEWTTLIRVAEVHKLNFLFFLALRGV
jgi:hypothetical protein